MQRAVVVVQTEQERTDTLAVLVGPEPGHDAVGGAMVLHLEHDPLVGLVGLLDRFGDDAVEPGTFEPREPVARFVESSSSPA